MGSQMYRPEAPTTRPGLSTTMASSSLSGENVVQVGPSPGRYVTPNQPLVEIQPQIDAVVDVVARESHVYALFSGRTRRGFPGRANFGAYIHVYAWDGSLVRVYELDTDALSLTVERDGSRLYVLRHHPSPGVIRYELTHEGAGLRREPVEGWRY